MGVVVRSSVVAACKVCAFLVLPAVIAAAETILTLSSLWCVGGGGVVSSLT